MTPRKNFNICKICFFSYYRGDLEKIPSDQPKELGGIGLCQLYNMDSVPFDLSKFLQKQYKDRDDTRNPLKKLISGYDLSKRFCTIHLTLRADGYEEEEKGL